MVAESRTESPATPAVDPINWFSNPLDWRPIDRMILLGSLVMLAPGLIGAGVGVGVGLIMIFAPQYLHFGVAVPMMVTYALHLLLLSGFLLVAMQKRQHTDDWPAFEAFVFGSFVFTVFGTGFLTGTHFAEAFLLIFLGLFIGSALGTIRRMIVAYYCGCALLAAFAVSDLFHLLPNAPALALPLTGEDGTVATGLVLSRIVLATVVLVIVRIALSAIARWVERESLYRDMSSIDGLTRLSNRRSFLERGEIELSRSKRFGDTPMACIMVDLDHFKRINDTWGHHAGDQVLVAASSILLNSKRQYDEVGRYGGEEFALLLPNTTAETATHVAERIRSTIAATSVEVDKQQIPMTASFGVAAYPADGISCLNDLLKAADRALYMAKDTGRNRVCVDAPAGAAG